MSFCELIKERYSVRKFDAKPIEKEKMDLILEAHRLAPTACNFQPQRILVLQADAMERLEACTSYRYGAPAAMVICYDKTVSWKNRSGKDIGDVDGTIVMTQMMYQAKELGLGSLLVGVFNETLLREQFQIPQTYEIVCLLMLGYAAEDCQPHPKHHANRKPLEETVFYGTF